MWEQLGGLRVVDGPVPWAAYIIGGVFALYLLGKSASGRWVAAAIIAIIVGAAAGFAATFVCVDLLNMFDAPISDTARFWVMGAFAGFALAIGNLWASRWWRKTIAIVAIPVFAAVAVIGINAHHMAHTTAAELVEGIIVLIP